MSTSVAPSRNLAALALVVALSGASSWIAHAQSPTGADRLARDPDVQGAHRLFTAWLEGQMLYRHLPGVAVGVVADQDLVWSAGFGFADTAAKLPMTPQTKFRMASHSKLFTATAVMQLREQGKLRLDDPVSKYLPWFQVKAADPDDPPITIEELLTHSSGLPREAGSHWTTFDFPTTEELRGLMAERQAPFSPDVRWKYSNLAYSVAGMVIEAVSGQRWADYVQQHIYAPLGMTSSSVDADVPGLAVGYSRLMPDNSRGTNPFIDARGMAAATGITSTVEDMARFASAQFRSRPEGRPAGPEHRLAARDAPRARARDQLDAGQRHRLLRAARARQGLRAARRQLSRLPDDHDAAAGGQGGGDRADQRRRRQSGRHRHAADEHGGRGGREGGGGRRRRRPRPTWDPAWSRFAGLYRGRGGESQVIELNKRLVVITPNAPDLDNPVQLVPIGNGQFRYTAPTGGGPVGEVVRFVEEGGRVVRMITGDSYVERVR